MGEPSKLVNANGLLKALFDEQSRPSIDWLHDQKNRLLIPHVKIGRLVFFDVESVRDAIKEQHTIGKRK